MATTIKLQSSFTAGELDPLLHARVDVEQYYKGAQTIRNLLTVPQGALQKRFGMLFLDDLDDLNVNSFDEVAIYTFEHSDGSSYFLLFTPELLTIYFEDARVATLATPYPASQISQLNVTQSIDRIIIVDGNVRPRELIRNSPHAAWTLGAPNFRFFPTFDFRNDYDTATFTPSATTGSITLTSTLPVFTPQHVGGIYRGGGGTLRIDSLTSGTVANGTVVEDFIDTSPIPGNLSLLSEVAFSDERGWPRTVTFFQNRLTFGGTTSLPNGIFLSVSGDYFNFNDSQANDDNAITDFVHGRDGNRIIHTVGYTSLLVFTDHGEYATSLVQEGAQTPSSFYLVEQTSHGISRTEIAFVDNQVIAIDRGGNIVRSYVYNSGTAKYDEVDISVFSPQLINNPIDVASYENTDRNNGTYLFYPNEDGTMASYQTLKEQGLSAWTLLKTDGMFGKIGNVNNLVYFVNKREINGQERFYLEKLDFNVLTDSAVVQSFGAPTNVITNLAHLEGKTVKVIGDGLVLNDQVVTGGQITIENEVTEVQVGLLYEPLLIPMPINIQTQNGNDVYFPKRVKAIYVDYYESSGILVNGVEVSSLQFGDGTSFDPIAPRTDFTEVSLLDGWNPRQKIEITQNQPLPMTIRGIGYEVDI